MCVRSFRNSAILRPSGMGVVSKMECQSEISCETVWPHFGILTASRLGAQKTPLTYEMMDVHILGVGIITKITVLHSSYSYSIRHLFKMILVIIQAHINLAGKCCSLEKAWAGQLGHSVVLHRDAQTRCLDGADVTLAIVMVICLKTVNQKTVLCVSGTTGLLLLV